MPKDEKEKELLDRILDLEAQIKKLKDRKRYGLVWEEKMEKFETESKNALPILREKGGKFPDIITDKKQDFNILIEGDNFHALSVLAYTHQNKVDVIYIDPPYNTGNKDFRYNDSFIFRENSYRHSSWLSFMAKRLKLAKNLLKQNGVIFISIDDNELSQLKLLCDEIFNEENFIGNLIWQRAKGGGNSKKVVRGHEYILCYTRNSELTLTQQGDKSVEHFKKYKSGKMNERYVFKKNKLYFVNDDVVRRVFGKYEKGIERRCEYENLLKFKGEKIKREIDEKIKNDEYLLKKNKEGLHYICRLEEVSDMRQVMYSIIQGFLSEVGKNDLAELEMNDLFDYPKPLGLVKILLDTIDNKNSIILDFFAGSGTTGHAVLDLNKKDGGKRKFILCTNNENKICEDITYERIKRVSLGYENSKGEKVAGLGGNLKYLKTDFVPLEKSADSLKQKIVEGSVEIICLKENAFGLICDNYQKNKIKIFQNPNKFVAILFDLFYFEEFVLELNKLKEKPVSVYVFSYTKEFSKDEFGDLGIDFSVEPIPEKILEVYKNIFKF